MHLDDLLSKYILTNIYKINAFRFQTIFYLNAF